MNTQLMADYNSAYCQAPQYIYDSTYQTTTTAYGCQLGYDINQSDCCNFAQGVADALWKIIWISVGSCVLCTVMIIALICCCIKSSNNRS